MSAETASRGAGAHAEIPLFPLNVVLVPEGHLPLRIFERRYLDMVRECSGEGKPFGVVLVLPPDSPDQPASHTRIGTAAHIRDFHTMEDGLLGIVAQGGERFQVTGTRSRDDGLLVGEVQYLPPTPDLPLPAEYGLLADIVRGFMEKVGDDYPAFEHPRPDDASWIGYRLTELLPLDIMEKQALLELDDPRTRLQALLEILPRFQVEDEDE
ncbi:MAG: LON peptidase substrate-binding domain-containing protein [Pseudomonadota bacterium]